MTGLLQVATATADREAAVVLVSEAVRRRLAVSAQISGPVISAFWHLGEFGTGEEWQAVMLTTVERYADLEAFLLAEHPWDNPQVTATAVVAASAACVAWANSAAG
jgi:periplasmic divalent cation tolerance protein